jgi:drug/metabolite transporter (DMT)-like permease
MSTSPKSPTKSTEEKPINQTMVATDWGLLVLLSVLFVPVTFLFGGPWVIAEPTLGSMASLVGLALLSTAIAYIVYFRLLASAGAVNMLLVTLLLPATAILLGVTFLDEMLTPRHIGGMGLIALGLAAMDGRPVRYCRAVLATRTR